MNRNKMVFAVGCFASALYLVSALPAMSQPDLRPLEPAQIPIIEKPAGENGSELRALKIKNVRPSLMAFWLDPKNNSLPAEYLLPYEIHKRVAPKDDSLLGLKPAGVRQIVGVDAQNLLLILSDAKGFEEIKEIVKFLDQPIRQVDIQIQHIDIQNEHLQVMDLDVDEKGWMSKSVGRDNAAEIQERLQLLTRNGRARIIDSQRATTANNVGAYMSRKTAHPMTVSIADANDERRKAIAQNAPLKSQPLLLSPAPEKNAPGASPNLKLIDDLFYNVTPTINNDDTITLFVHMGQALLLQDADQSQIVLHNKGWLSTTANVKSDDLIILSVPKFYSVQGPPAVADEIKPAQNKSFILVRARIIEKPETKTLDQPIPAKP